MSMKRCPVCGVSVKLENLERHVKNQHPHEKVDLQATLTEEEKREAVARKASARPSITRRGRRLMVILAVVLAAVLVVVILNPFRPTGPAVGQVAPDFSVRTTSGTMVVLSSLRGLPVLLEFMDVDCPACQAEAPTLVRLYANYSANVRFVSIDVNFVGAADDDAKITTFMTGYGTTWAYALDASRSIQNAYGVDRTPTTFILDRDGVVRNIFQPPANTYAAYVAALNGVLGG